MRILTICRTRNKAISARDAQKADRRLLESGECFNCNLTCLLQIQHHPAFLMGPLVGASALPPSKLWPKIFVSSIPGR